MSCLPYVFFLFSIFFSFKIEAENKAKRFFPAFYPLSKSSFLWQNKTEFFHTMGTVDETGKRASFKSNEFYRKLDNNLSFYYAMASNFSIGLELLARYHESSPMQEDSSVVKLSSGGLESFKTFFLWNLMNTPSLSWTLEVFARQTFYQEKTSDPIKKETPDKERLVLGDDGSYLTFLLHGRFKIGTAWEFLSSLGYQKTPIRLSPEIPYNFAFSFAPKNTRWMFFLGTEGILSLKQDRYQNTPEEKEQVPSGMSADINSINRSFISPYTQLGFGISENFLLSVKGFFQYGLTSSNSGPGAMLQLSMGNFLQENTAKKHLESFKQYEFEAIVSEVSEKQNYVRINNGERHYLQLGQKFDIFRSDYKGGEILVAQAVLIKIFPNHSILKVTIKFSRDPIQKGDIARGN